MGSVNLIMVMGEVERDAVLKDAGGTPLSEFIVTTREEWVDRNQKPHKRVDQHKIELWGKTAEILTPRLRKGQPVYVEGKIQTKQWEDKERRKHSETSVRAKRVELLAAIPPNQPEEDQPAHEDIDDSIF